MVKHKHTSAKKPAAKPAPKVAQKSAPTVVQKPLPKGAQKPAPKVVPTAPDLPPAIKEVPVAKTPQSSPTIGKPSKKTALRDSILKRKAASKPIAFSLDEVRAIAQTVTSKTLSPFPEKSSAKEMAASKQAAADAASNAKPQHVKAASLADILGFNPKKSKRTPLMADKDVPEKFKRYYRLLLDLRSHLTEDIERHSEETLKRSSKDDAGDLSAYGQHMADAGTDTFDRDFALSMVANEQEALSEIDAAIKRIDDGTYGICEINQMPIAKERLLAVPFTRYSAEAQKNLERNRHRSRTQAGLFGEMGEEGGKIMEDDGGE